ncbi:MAG: carbohydrate binding domain-containing protein, partial [Armatimonadota bacterium]
MFRCAAVGAFLASWVATAGAQAPWHHPLYLHNGDYWRQRERVRIRNEMEREALGDPVTVRIGKGDGDADLVGALAEQVRVCDAQGTEMLYEITDPGGRPVHRGPIRDGSTLTLPAECPAGEDAEYYVYFDNPAAWPVPDFLQGAFGVRNGSVEEGAGDTPFAWRHDPGDQQHRAYWVTEDPHSGKRCLKTIVAEGAQPTWIATRQSGIHIIGGARYVMEAWVKAENVDGYAGWYIHVGNQDNFMIISPMLRGGGGTYDWKKVRAEFTAPDEANRADLGTVLRGTGTAWFDDVTLECSDAPRLRATAARPQRLQLAEAGAETKWYDDDPDDAIRWEYRVPVRVMNFSAQPARDCLVHVDVSALAARLRGKFNEDSVRVTFAGKTVPHYDLGNALLFDATIPARTVQTYYVYLSSDDRIPPRVGSDYAALLESDRNLVKNPSFELGDVLPTDWPGGAEGDRPAGTVTGLDEPGLFGKRCARIHIPHGAKTAWTGWRQDVPVEPGKTYLYAAWVKCEDIRDGSVKIHAHYRNAAGGLCKTKHYTGAGSPISGTKDWTLMSGWFEMPEDVATFQLHLTMLATGTVWHDGVLLAEATRGAVGELQARAARGPQALTAWPVNALIKVFREDLPPRQTPEARMSAARNEKEPLQIAVRSPRALRDVTVRVEPPKSGTGARLTDVETAVVGYVPIDHETNYYHTDTPEWHRKYPTTPGACDGWPGMWPDPLLPRDRFDLPADTTQPIWITVAVPKDAAAGDYVGKVRLIADGRAVAQVPFTVHVWDFALPERNHVAAIYDVRLGRHWSLPGWSRDKLLREFWRFMAQRRVCPNRVQPDPVIRYDNGRVIADFTEFDEAAEYYFDVLGLPHTYTPWYFYCFGWGHPPRNMFGEAPYEGDYPYEGVD